MDRMNDAIPASEAVEWRWPRGGDNARGVLVGLVLLGLAGASLGGAFWTGLVSGDFTEISGFALAMAALHLGIPLLVGKVRAVAITAQRIVIRDGRFPGKIRTIYRDLLQFVVHYEASGYIALYGRDGELYGAPATNKAGEVLEALGLPVVAWKRRELGRGAKVLRLLPFIFMVGLFVVAQTGMVMLLTSDWFEGSRGALKPYGWVAFPIVMAPVVGVMALIAILGAFLSVAAGRVFASPQALSEFLRSLSDPYWMGARPPAGYPRTGLVGRFFLGSARLLGAKLVDLPDHEPELQNGATPDMAARARVTSA